MTVGDLRRPRVGLGRVSCGFELCAEGVGQGEVLGVEGLGDRWRVVVVRARGDPNSLEEGAIFLVGDAMTVDSVLGGDGEDAGVVDSL